MPKKLFLKEGKKKSKHAPQVPNTADEYLATGVDFEEAGEKWRGGDASKSTRFFIRAIDCYEEGLKRFPASFDLAYNKARVQYELTQHPKLLKQLPGSPIELLQTALLSSRFALSLNQNNADVLFNTAQVLTSLVDGGGKHIDDTQEGDRAASALLEEALELFQRCAALQETRFESFQAQLASATATASAEPVITEETPKALTISTSLENEGEDGAEQWATIEEPVYKETLLDTVLAQLETLSALYTRYARLQQPDGKAIYRLEAYATPIITQKLAAYATGTERELDAAVGRAVFMSAVADVRYRMVEIDYRIYATNVQEAWASLNLENHVEGLCNRAESYVTCSNFIKYSQEADQQPLEIAKTSWTLLTLALQDLATASKFRDDDNIGSIFITRGDGELLRCALGRKFGYDVAIKNTEVLTKNAEKFYRGAKVLTAGDESRTQNDEATIKEAMVKAILRNPQELIQLRSRGGSGVDLILWDAVNDDLCDPEVLGL